MILCSNKQESELCDYVSNNSKVRLPPLFQYQISQEWKKNRIVLKTTYAKNVKNSFNTSIYIGVQM